jgi:hypothetical protein
MLLPRTEGEPFRLLLADKDIFVMTHAGEAIRIGSQNPEIAFELQTSAEENVVAVASIGDHIVVLTEPSREGSARLCITDGKGKQNAIARLPITTPHHRIVAVPGFVYVFDQLGGNFVQFSLTTYTLGSLTTIPSANPVIQTIGLFNSKEHRLVVAAVNGPFGEVFVFDPLTGDKAKICPFLPDQNVQLAVSAGKLIVAQGSNEPSLNTIKQYEIFEKL